MIRLPSAANPEVSLIVLLDGAPELAEGCLRALANDDSIPCETIVLLNDPDPALEDLVRKSTEGGKVIVSRANAGPGVGWNLGASVATAPRLATLHEDSEPDAGWLIPLVEALTETGAGAVGARLYNHDGSVQNCGWVLFSNAAHQPLTASSAPDVVAATEPTPADMLSGAASLFDRAAVDAIGGWDERFFPAVFVDIDISTAMWNQGRLVLSVPASGVRHLSGTFDRRPNTVLTGPRLRSFLFERNRHRFIAKWGPAVTNLAEAPPDAEPETIRAAVQAALPRTRERAERVRSGKWQPPDSPQSPERLYTGVPEPVLEQGRDINVVASEVEEALNTAQQNLVNDYCRWLTQREAEVYDQLLETHEALEQHRQALTDTQAYVAELQREHEKVATALNDILHGRTWRLRTMVLNTLQRLRNAARRLAGGRRIDR